ncbi:sensor protein PhoQ [Chania multitudinisentens RB-25]|uniref:histidine kinase n=1 Tax=Chania multitudinisentens RB-25 TaxID=1441930 RepID=A0A0D4ZYI3_9GAMM|nr:two-component system sensor histidine kinase PhoQ [Chania multitudinisentens]AJW28958.1 sensor protein PhoQ [Chania multitudinisentens RB-25]
MLSKHKDRKPFSLRARFLMATAGVILALSLSYGLVAIVGYIVSFDKTSFRLLRSESNLFFNLAQWKDQKLTIDIPPDLVLNSPTLVFIYDNKGNLLWSQRQMPELESLIKKEWLGKESGFYELDTDTHISSEALGNNSKAQIELKNYDGTDKNTLTHSVAINSYAATPRLPALSIAVVDSTPQELQRSDMVWEWFSYVLLANLLLVVPLLWLAAHWSLRPIKALVIQIGQLENGEREKLDENPPNELQGLVRNLNILVRNERQRYTKYHTTLSDLTHSLKTPLAVLQTTLRSLRSGNQTTIEEAEPIMLEQISRISQQIGYYLHRASINSGQPVLTRGLHSVPALLDSLTAALNKVYQRKGITITLDISPEVIFMGEKNDFMEVMGNVLENACKYCLEFVEITSLHSDKYLTIVIDDDGPGIPESKRELIFQRGQRVDTLCPGQGLGLSVAAEIIEQYDGQIIISDNPLGGTRVKVIFARQHDSNNYE